jgi:hypothetical protein
MPWAELQYKTPLPHVNRPYPLEAGRAVGIWDPLIIDPTSGTQNPYQLSEAI